jgi:hypothetical protein
MAGCAQTAGRLYHNGASYAYACVYAYAYAGAMPMPMPVLCLCICRCFHADGLVADDFGGVLS